MMMTEFITTVKEMRRLQRNYRKTFSTTAKAEVQRLENSVDRALKEHERQLLEEAYSKQGDLFG